jgi:hypothetical protein
VRAFFTGAAFPERMLNTQHEYAVKAAVQTGPSAGDGTAVAAWRTPALVGNGIGEVPIGGNAGAFGAGFTTGPEAFRVTFDSATNTATVLYDQRVFFNTADSYVLLDANGTPLPGGVGVLAGPAATGATTPGSYVVTVSFTGASVSNAKALEIKGIGASPSAAAAGASVDPEGNAQQIVSPTASAAVLRRGAKVHWVHVALKKHHTKKHHKH